VKNSAISIISLFRSFISMSLCGKKKCFFLNYIHE
jgi:hypothetical protein